MNTRIIIALAIISLVCAISLTSAIDMGKKHEYRDRIANNPVDEVPEKRNQQISNTGSVVNVQNAGGGTNVQYTYNLGYDPFNYDTSQPIDQGDAAWQQIAFPINLNGAWKADVIFNHDWSNPAWTIVDALDEAAANQVPYYIYSAELYPKNYAVYVSEQFANMWP